MVLFTRWSRAGPAHDQHVRPCRAPPDSAAQLVDAEVSIVGAVDDCSTSVTQLEPPHAQERRTAGGPTHFRGVCQAQYPAMRTSDSMTARACRAVSCIRACASSTVRSAGAGVQGDGDRDNEQTDGQRNQRFDQAAAADDSGECSDCPVSTSLHLQLQRVLAARGRRPSAVQRTVICRARAGPNHGCRRQTHVGAGQCGGSLPLPLHEVTSRSRGRVERRSQCAEWRGTLRLHPR